MRNKMAQALAGALHTAGISDDLTAKALDSGYYLRTYFDPFSKHTYHVVSDCMYGSKQLSSCLEIDKFIDYLKGEDPFQPAPPLRRHKVKTRSEIQEILSEPRLAHNITQGLVSFRGQTQEHKIKRHIPNPIRADENGFEVSILAGLYRQNAPFYSFSLEPQEKRTLEFIAQILEPNNPCALVNYPFTYDAMRVEQHYATQTAGLDITFDLETALFFSTHEFVRLSNGKALHRQIPQGAHKGVIYCFRFCDPPVKKTEYYIQDFDLFKSLRPERVLRQKCGLPLFAPQERNIAVADIHCVIEFDPDFSGTSTLTPEWMFPRVKEDRFYEKLLELKDRFPEDLAEVVEYEWAR
jgi:hypothetical protein